VLGIVRWLTKRAPPIHGFVPVNLAAARKKLGPRQNVRVNCIAPGLVQTERSPPACFYEEPAAPLPGERRAGPKPERSRSDASAKPEDIAGLCALMLASGARPRPLFIHGGAQTKSRRKRRPTTIATVTALSIGHIGATASFYPGRRAFYLKRGIRRWLRVLMAGHGNRICSCAGKRDPAVILFYRERWDVVVFFWATAFAKGRGRGMDPCDPRAHAAAASGSPPGQEKPLAETLPIMIPSRQKLGWRHITTTSRPLLLRGRRGIPS